MLLSLQILQTTAVRPISELMGVDLYAQNICAVLCCLLSPNRKHSGSPVD